MSELMQRPRSANEVEREQAEVATQVVSLIIPTYNERKNIGRIVRACLDSFEGTAYDPEILVMDDASPDGTWDLVVDEFGNDERVRAVSRPDNHGLAPAVSEGFEMATGEYCVVIDADFQHPPEKIPELLAALDDGADVAIGSRHIENGGIENWSAFRKLVSWGATKVAKVFTPTARGISDPMSGFFAVRRSVVEDVELQPQGYKILLEVLAKCDVDQVAEVPYIFRERERGESKLTAGQYQQFVEHCLALAVFSYGLVRFVAPQRAVRATEFGIVGVLGTVVNTGVFGLSHLFFSQHYLVAGVMAFTAAVNFNFLGNWAVTYDRPKEQLVSKYLQFNLVSIAGFAVYTITLAALIRMTGIPPLISNVIAIGTSSLMNFLGTDTVAFEPETLSN